MILYFWFIQNWEVLSHSEDLFVQFHYSFQFNPAFINSFLLLLGNWQRVIMKVLWKLKSLGSVQKKKKKKERKKKEREQKTWKAKKNFMVFKALSSNERIIDCFWEFHLRKGFELLLMIVKGKNHNWDIYKSFDLWYV